jgi:hypothetical protein
MSTAPRFTWKSADGATHEFEITAAEISIGRAPTCDIVLPDDQMVSRRHAIVRRQGDTATVVDLGSSNGTLINGVEIHDATTLKEGDKVTIGDQDLLFEEARESVTAGSTFGAAPAFGTATATPSPFGQPSQPFSQPTPTFGAPSQPFGQPSQPLTPANDQPTDSPFFSGTPSKPVYPAASAQTDSPTITQDVVGLGGFTAQSYGSYSHVVNGQEVEREEERSSYQGQLAYDIPAASPEPAKPDAAALLANIQNLHTQLNEQIVSANQATDQVRASIREALLHLDSALSAAQSASQQSALSDLQQLASNVSQTQRMDLAVSFASRASELRDVLAAHQQLLQELSGLRQQLQQTLNG